MASDSTSVKDDQNDHWLVRRSTIKLMWWVGCGVLALTVIAQFFIPVKGYFGIDSWPAFGAVFGFASCVAMVVFAKLLGVVLKRREDYYHEGEEDV